jgi:hypothetical protein
MGGDIHQAQFPRLAISDLIVLTLSVAFAFACVAPGYQEALREGQVTAWQVLPDLIDYLAYGLLLFGLIVLARQRIRGSDDALSPGQVLVLVVAPFSTLALMSIPLRSLLWVHFPENKTWIGASDNGLFILVIGASIALTLPKLRLFERRWRVFLVLVDLWLLVSALWLGLEAVRHFGVLTNTPWHRHLIVIGVTFQLLASAAGTVALAIDLLHGIRRDWLHNMGTAAFLMMLVGVIHNWGWSTARWWRDLVFHVLP